MKKLINEYNISFVFAVLIILVLSLISSCQTAHACSREESELTETTRQKLSELKELANAEGIDFKVICTHRTQAEQDHLYAKGRTSPGSKVTWTKRSRHTDREAFDVVIVKRNGDLDWRGESYVRIGTLGKRIGLVWGGDWKVRDYGHFETDIRRASK